MLGFIKRCCSNFQSTNSIWLLYCSLVRPHLEYGSCVWSPFYNVHIQNIERVQHKFLRHMAYRLNLPGTNFYQLNYNQIEEVLHLTTLGIRRNLRDMSVFYNILHSRNSCQQLLAGIAIHIPSRPTCQAISFHIPAHRTNYGYNSFLARTARLANHHSSNVDCFDTPARFRKSIIEFIS